MSEKKVVVVIVEGPSDEASLGPVLKAWFNNEEVRFVVICGDITTDGTSSHDTIVRRIDEHVKKLMQRYRYGKKDILRIIHICDTDGAFAKDTVRQADVPSIRYHSDHVDAPDALSVIARNERKSRLLFKLRTTGRVNGIEYRIYYNSCNLEHVLWNRRNVSSSHEKIRLSDEFAE